MNRWLKQALYGLIPGTCILCEARTRRNLDLCRDCERDLPWLTKQCYRCALPLASPDPVCGACISSPPPFEHCFAAFEYADPIDRLIREFKNNQQLLTGKVLASLLASAFSFYHHADDWPDLLVPVPLHRSRLRRRGYNQAAEIADVIADQCNLHLDGQLCRKIRETQDQKTLDVHARRANIRGAWQLDRRVEGLRIALIDDVVTTGATASELAGLLLRGGAASVHVIALARTPRPTA